MDLKQYLIDEFVEDYQEGHLSRRQAFRLLAGITGAATATALLAGVAEPATALAQGPRTTPKTEPVANSVSESDPRVLGGPVLFPGGDATLLGYMARPAGDGQYPIVLVCHENRGLTTHIQDVTRRLALAGYVGLAVDLLSREGGTAAVVPSDGIPGLLSGAPAERHIQDFQSGLSFVQAKPFAIAERAGMVGFCFGGGVTWRVATGIPALRAAVPFYGPPPPVADVPKINAAVLAIYAGKDDRINGSIPTIEPAMQQNNKTYQKLIYPDVDHAFNNDTGPRYNAAAALDAWEQTLAWFQRYL